MKFQSIMSSSSEADGGLGAMDAKVSEGLTSLLLSLSKRLRQY